MDEIRELQKQIATYGKTREIYKAYLASGKNADFYETHRGDITLHRAAKKHFNELGLERLPKIADLKKEFAELLTEKKKCYAGYKEKRENMMELSKAEYNATRMLGLDKNVPGRGSQKRSISLGR